MNAYHLPGTILSIQWLMKQMRSLFSWNLQKLCLPILLSTAPQGLGYISYLISTSTFSHFLFSGSFLTIQVQGTLNFKNVYILSLNSSLATSLFFLHYIDVFPGKSCLYLLSWPESGHSLKMLLPRPSLNPMDTFQFLVYLAPQQGLIFSTSPSFLKPFP